MSVQVVKCPKHDVNHYCNASRPDDPCWEPYRYFIFQSECGSKNPAVSNLSCRKLKDHDGDHAAYMFSIVTPSEWPAS